MDTEFDEKGSTPPASVPESVDVQKRLAPVCSACGRPADTAITGLVASSFICYRCLAEPADRAARADLLAIQAELKRLRRSMHHLRRSMRHLQSAVDVIQEETQTTRGDLFAMWRGQEGMASWIPHWRGVVVAVVVGVVIVRYGPQLLVFLASLVGLSLASCLS